MCTGQLLRTTVQGLALLASSGLAGCSGLIGDAPAGPLASRPPARPQPTAQPTPSPSASPTPSPTPSTNPAPELNAAQARLRRLDPDQLAATARDLLDLRDEDVSPLRIPLDEGTVPSLLTVDRLDAAATAVTALGAHHSFAPCAITGAGSPECAEAFITAFGGRAFRRPLTAEESAWLRGVYQGARAQFSFAESIDVLARVILASPQFLYVLEEGVEEAGLPSGLLRLTPWELASRLSYFLWDTMPDDALLSAAAGDRLKTSAEVLAQVDRMLADPRARAKFIRFTSKLMELNGTARHVSIEEAVKDPTRFPLDSPALRQAMRQEIESFVGKIWDEGGSLEALFTSRDAYVNGPLAQLYGVSGGPTRADEWAWVSLPASQRAGVATRAAFLFVYATPEIPSPIRLGAAIWRDFLCYTFPPPPPEAMDVRIVPGEQGGRVLSIRQAVEAKTSGGNCVGCHAKMNPAGFTFGHYDALGQWQDEERGVTPTGANYTASIDSTGELVGSDVTGVVPDALALSAKLASSRQVKSCFATRTWGAAFGRPPQAGEESSVRYVQDKLAATGSIKDAIRAVVDSPGFRHLRKGTP